MERRTGGKFKVGQKVWLEHTREEAVITKIDKTGVLYVKAGAHVIPVFMSQVTKRLPEKPEANVAGALVTDAPKEEAPPPRNIDPAKVTKARVCLLFIPQRLKDGEIAMFECGLLNETNDAFAASVAFLKDNGDESFKASVGATRYALVTTFSAEKINDIVSVKLVLTPKDAALDIFETDVKIKAASFIKKNALVSSLGTEAFVYELLEQFEKAPQRKDVFKEYNEAKASKKKLTIDKHFKEESTEPETNWNLEHLRQLILDKPVAKEKVTVEAEKEIDLHVESFLVDTEGLNATDILLLQLERFRKSLERAIVSGQKVFTVVHGVGKGKLKKEIEKILSDHELVIDFRDASYPKYGYGATDVFLKQD